MTFEVRCITRPANQVFYLTLGLHWSHQDNRVPALVFRTKAAARDALRRAYRHPADDHEIIPRRDGE